MKISLKARNVPKLFGMWVIHGGLFLACSKDVSDFAVWQQLLTLDLAPFSVDFEDLIFLGLLTLVSIFDGLFPRSVKEKLVFWHQPRPGSRAFSHFMCRDSTIDRNAIKQICGPLPTVPDEQNALWARWLNEFEDDPRVRPTYGRYLFARDWSVVAAATAIVGSLLLLFGDTGTTESLAYCLITCTLYLAARQFGKTQGEQLVMSVLACKGAALGSSKVDKRKR